MSEPKVSTYDLTSRINHWIVAITIIALVSVGLYLEFFETTREQKIFLYGIHKATGVLVLIYGLWRVFWRLKQGFPTTVANMSDMQSKLAKISHRLLLLSILLMPISGIVMSLFAGRKIDVFGLFVIPAQEKIEWLSSFAADVHVYSGRALAILIVIHFLAALKHHFIDKDKTLARMLKG